MIGLAIFISLLVNAQSEDSLPIFYLGEIVVTGEKTALLTTTYEITAQDIELKNAHTVDEALDFIPGIRLSVGAKNEPNVRIRGLRQEKVLVLLDGVPIANPRFGYVDLSQIPVENIAKIQVIKGSASTLYGPNAMGGVINIITKERGVGCRVEGISNGYNVGLHCGKRLKIFNFGLSASRSASDGFRLSNEFESARNEDGGLRENSDYTKNSFALKFGLMPTQTHQAGGSFIYIDNDKGIPPDVSSDKPRYWRFTEWKRWTITFVDELKLTDKLSVKGRIFYDKYDNTLNSYDDATYSSQTKPWAWTSIYDEYALGGNFYFHFKPHQQHTFKVGGHIKSDVHKEQDDVGKQWERYSRLTYSSGIEDEWILTPQLLLIGGISYDALSPKEAYQSNPGKDISMINPLVGVVYSLTPSTLFRVSWARKGHFPTMHQLYYDGDGDGIGNIYLKPERNANYEVGIKTESVEVCGFFNKVDNLIERAARHSDFSNISAAELKGIEINATRRYKDGAIRLGYAYLHAIDKEPELIGRIKDELPYTPKHKMDLEVRFTTEFGVEFCFLSSFNGESYYYTESGAQHSVGSYWVHNLQATRKIFNKFLAFISAKNILDTNYEEEKGFPQPGRTIELGIKYKP